MFQTNCGSWAIFVLGIKIIYSSEEKQKYCEKKEMYKDGMVVAHVCVSSQSVYYILLHFYTILIHCIYIICFRLVLILLHYYTHHWLSIVIKKEVHYEMILRGTFTEALYPQLLWLEVKCKYLPFMKKFPLD